MSCSAPVAFAEAVAGAAARVGRCYTRAVRIELHCHSTCSDGSFSPEEVARRAAAAQVELFCLTDHDTVEGCARAAAELPEGVRTLPSLELSTKHEGRTVHLLMYGLFDADGRAQLEETLGEIRHKRIARVREICERFAALGVAELEPDDILRGAHGSPGRPHVARAVVEAGAATSIREVFDRWLHDGGPAYVDIDRYSLEEGVAAGVRAGARMSIAHPHTLKSWDLVRDVYRQLRDAGLEGIEAYYGKYGPAQREQWLRLAEELELVVTGGSDFHGEVTPDVAGPVIDLPEPHATALRAWLSP